MANFEMNKTAAIVTLLTLASSTALAAEPSNHNNENAHQSSDIIIMGTAPGNENHDVNKVGLLGTAGMVVSVGSNGELINSMHSLKDGLSNLNVNRGGAGGTKGFVAEHLEAAEISATGRKAVVLDDNGVADLKVVGKNGHDYYKQMKVGKSYNANNIDFEKYRGQQLIVDTENPNFQAIKKTGAKHGVKVVRGNVSASESQLVADAMRAEANLFGTKTATIVPKAIAANKAGMAVGKQTAAVGGLISAGCNVVDVVNGKKTVGEAVVDTAVDTAKSGATGYAVGAIQSLTSTAGTQAASTVAKAGTMAAVKAGGMAMAKNAGCVGALISAGSNIVDVANGKKTVGEAVVDTAVDTAVSAATGYALGAVASTSAGAAVLGAASTAGTAALGIATATGAAVAGATVAAAPFVAAGVVVAGICDFFWGD
ncbi:MAG: hypothetical protein Q4D21_03100 [Phascolarctobacterium sp.]|nr:hypothetical protein [Phascolarctobacterium sp.]